MPAIAAASCWRKAATSCAHVSLDRNSRYEIPDLLPGNYTFAWKVRSVDQDVSLLPGQEEAIVNLDLSRVSAEASASTFAGRCVAAQAPSSYCCGPATVRNGSP